MHLIMLETFKPRPVAGLECDHINGNKLDYSLKNLRWVSGKLNISFYNPQGYKGKYIATFQKQTWGSFDTPAQARRRHLEVKTTWQAEERKRLLQLASAEALNWC